MRQTFFSIFSLIVALGTAGAQASVITETAPVSFSGIDAGVVTLLVPGVDRTAGILSGYSFTMTGLFQASLKSTAPQPLDPPPTFANSVKIEPFAPIIDLGTAAARPTSPATLGESTPISFTATLPLAYVTSAQADGLDLTLFFAALLSGANGDADSETMAFSGEIRETFTYDPPTRTASLNGVPNLNSVPEPASAALIGTALLGAGLRLRRRKH